MSELELAPSDFVALLNQTLEFAYPSVTIRGELANMRVGKSRWLYFDLKDEIATVHFFGTVYQLPGPLEDGMLVKVRGTPRLHPQYGFSVTVQTIVPAGEGSIKKAAKLLEASLASEGLFSPARKRVLPYPPVRIGLITSAESAAYRDFVKVLGARWGGIAIELIDVQVQGEPAPGQIVRAIAHFNERAVPPDVLVITRGGGSAEDLQAFNTEQVTRAVAASRIPTLVAIGHEVDVSLAELAADCRASTPSNAAELLVPDRSERLTYLRRQRGYLTEIIWARTDAKGEQLRVLCRDLSNAAAQACRTASHGLAAQAGLLAALNPEAALRRGFAIVRKDGQIVEGVRSLELGDVLDLSFVDADLQVAVQRIQVRKERTRAKK